MPAKRFRDPWVEPVRQIVSDHADWGRHAVHDELVQRAETWGLRSLDVPSDSTVGRIMTEFRRADPAQRRDYERFHWPESLGADDLPWEAGRALLDLLAYLDAHAKPRPPIRLARWYWRLTLAAPDASIPERLSHAISLASEESVAGSVSDAWTERFLAYAPWRDELNEELLMLSTVRSLFLERGWLAASEEQASAAEHTIGEKLRTIAEAWLGPRSPELEAASSGIDGWLERVLEEWKTSDPKGFAAVQLDMAQHEQAHREATFLSGFKPPPSDDRDWRLHAIDEAKRALGWEGEREQASE